MKNKTAIKYELGEKMKKEFYEKTKESIPSMLLKKFFENNKTKEIKTAMDLGCGAGKDTKYLIEKGIKVIAVDINDISRYIDTENSKLTFIKSKIEELKFVDVDLINAQNSLSFCEPEKFEEIMNKIKKAINKNGYFVGNFFGKKDSWSKKENMTFLSKEEVIKIFEKFKIMYIAEIEEKGKTVLGKEKHWHIISIIACNK